MTSTSGRSAASSSLMSGGRATSQTIAPGLHWLMSRIRSPKADVAVTIMSHSPIRSCARVETVTRAPGVSRWIVRLRSIRRSGSIETSTTSRIAWAIIRAQTDPIDPVAPITITRPFVRSVVPMRIAASLAASSVAATVRLFPLVMAMGALLATVTPASPTTLVKAPRPMIRAPRRCAILAALVNRLYVKRLLRRIICRGVAPRAINCPSTRCPVVGERTPVILDTWNGGRCAANDSTSASGRNRVQRNIGLR